MTILSAGVADAAPAAVNYCNVTAICFFYDGNETGAWWDGGTQSIDDFAGATFGQGSLDGAGKRVKNDAASVYNGSNLPLCVYYDEHFQGRYDVIAPGSAANLVQTWNNNASYQVKHGGC